ncbi:MAG TPA: ABC transporter permease [Gemmatimonadaceae bacterium]|nr:ABC transporter permease [Gemmatimonadaceae bacterium]
MRGIVSWFRRLFNHTRSAALSSEIEREMAFHLAERTDDLVAGGMSPAAARREARRRFGNVTLQRERTRERDLFGWLDSLAGDVRYTLRALRAAKVFAAVAILSLALGIGANTAIFSILNAVMLKSLPVAHPEQLVSVRIDGAEMSAYTNPLWEALRDRQDVFSGAFAYGATNFNLTAGGEARRILADWVSGDYFATLGVRPAAGRLLSRADDYRGCPGTAVLDYGFWRSNYARDPDVIGRNISLDGHPFTVIGVTDARFYGLDVGYRSKAYVPLCAEAIVHGTNSQLDLRSSWFLHVVGRPKPGMTTAQLDARLAMLAPAIIDATLPPDFSVDALKNYKSMKFTANPVDKGFSGLRLQYRKALYILMTIVGLVLLIACANVANLVLARAAARQREMAVRRALGATRARLARQLVTESLLLSAIGALLGVLFAASGSRLLVSLMSHVSQPVSLDLSIDQRMLVFTIAVTALTGLLFGLVPAWRAGRVDPQSAMKAQSRGVAEGHSRFNLGKSLVTAQVALSLVLVVGAGLLVGSWRRLATVDPGFDKDNVLLIDADIRGTNTAAGDRLALHDRMLARLRAVPGVRAAAASQLTPLSGKTWNDAIKVDGNTPSATPDELPWANAVSDGYFATLGIPLRAGRDFDSRDGKTSPRVVIVNDAFVRKFFHGGPAIGHTIYRQEGKDFGPPLQVIGVVGSTKYRSLRDSTPPVMYFARAQESAVAQHLSFEVRTQTSPLAAIPAMKAAFAEIDPRITLDFTSLDEQLAESLMLMRTIATLSGFFGLLALLLATIGLYGIMAYTVARRRNEIGVRIALGATHDRVIRLVLGESGRIVVGGVILGVGLSWAATRLVQSFLYGLDQHDPRTLAAAALLLSVVGIAAAAIPAVRAARLDPVAALREE